ncbi:MAG TPA: hypothetical protein VGL20_13815 [Candidatus Dormibacteraeota bacterium]|jgi:hypothetical protein
MEGVRRSRRIRAGGGVFVVCTALAAAFSARAGAALSYDGGYYLYNILQWRQPFTPYDRHAARLVQFPVLALAHVTDDLRWLRLAFCVAYAAVPVVVALLCWLLVRRRAPDLMVWVALGLGLVALPGALFQVSESMIVALVSWPLLVAVLLDLETVAAVVGAGAAAFAFYESALSAAAFALVGLVALARALRNPRNRLRLLAFGAGLLVLIPLRYRALPIDYAGSAHTVSVEVLSTVFRSSAAWRPFIAVVATWLAGATLLASRWWPGLTRTPRRRLVIAGLQIAGVTVAGVVLLTWAQSPTGWAGMLDYRDLAMLFECPLLLMAALDAAPARTRPDRPLRSWLTAGAGVGFAVVVISLSLGWRGQVDDLRGRLSAQSTTCVPPELVERYGTATGMWATPSLAIVLQSRSPSRLVLSPADCALLHATPPVVRIAPWDTTTPAAGWFRFPVVPQASRPQVVPDSQLAR